MLFKAVILSLIYGWIVTLTGLSLLDYFTNTVILLSGSTKYLGSTAAAALYVSERFFYVSNSAAKFTTTRERHSIFLQLLLLSLHCRLQQLTDSRLCLICLFFGHALFVLMAAGHECGGSRFWISKILGGLTVYVRTQV